MASVKEGFDFRSDTERTDEGKNVKLSDYLRKAGVWRLLTIVRIERIEIGPKKGWEVTYRRKR